MTKKELFTKAHEMTREVKAEYPEVNYRAQFSICLKMLMNKENKKENKTEGVAINMLLNKKMVEVNGFQREVALKIENNKMFGVINKVRFIWNYAKNPLPKLEVPADADGVKAAKYGRLYILKRLELDNIVLPIKTNERTVEYIHIEEKNGVWMNCFKNGYIRGSVDGVPFTWDPSKYSFAAVVNVAGFKGNITQKIDTNRIKHRLKEAGYSSLNELKKSIA